MPTTSLPVESATVSTYDRIAYDLVSPFKSPLYLSTVNVTLDPAPGAVAVTGTIRQGRADLAGNASVTVNRAKFDELLTTAYEHSLSLTLSWNPLSRKPVGISCASTVVVAASYESEQA